MCSPRIFDNDGWPDIYVANDSTASALYQNKKMARSSTLTLRVGLCLSPGLANRRPGWAVSAADYDLDGNLDIVETNFAGDTPVALSTNQGGANSEDTTFTAGLGLHNSISRLGMRLLLTWITMVAADILICNGHVYPEVEQLKTEAEVRRRETAVSQPAQWPVRGCVSECGRRNFRSGGVARMRFRRLLITTVILDVVVNTVNGYPPASALRSAHRKQIGSGAHHRNEIQPQRNWSAG